MEYVLLAIVLLEGGFITYLMTKTKKPTIEPTIEEKEKQRQERIERDFAKLFSYNETIATRGYKDE